MLAKECYQKYCIHTKVWILFDKKTNRPVASSKDQYITVPLEG